MIETPGRTLEQKHVPGHRTARTLYWKADVELRAAKLTAFVGVVNLLHNLAPVGPSIVALVRPGIHKVVANGAPSSISRLPPTRRRSG